ncbi:MAG: alpha-ketoglutarate-dependent dioxygenase AlkB [Myxococcota bacterium]
MVYQPPLFAPAAPRFDPTFRGLERHALTEGAWVERLPGWLVGEGALFTALEASTAWRAERRVMYEREVAVPRLTATLPEDGPGHPVVTAMGQALVARYGAPLRHVSLALYRDGADSVAFHGDRGRAALPGALTVSVSLGAPRRLLLRPARGGASVRFELGGGDLFVMGGTCQQTWQHGIPKVARAGPRLVVLYWMGAGV